MQEALCYVNFKIFMMSKGVHESLAEFRWLEEDVSNRPAHIYELVPLRPTADGYHDAFGYMCGSVVLTGLTAIPRILLS